MNQSISVIICTRDRPEYLQECIASILRQSMRPKEIIVVDDASKERFDIELILRKAFSFTEKLANLLPIGEIKIKYVRNKHRQGIVKSRNLGIALAKGNVIAFIDDDGYAHKDWLKNLSKYYQNKYTVGVGGPVVEIGRKIETRNEIKRLSYITPHGDIKHNYRIKRIKDVRKLRIAYVRFLMGGNMSFKRDVLMGLNGFNPQYKGNYYREETDMCLRASKSGKVIFEPSAVTYHNTARHGGTRDIVRLDSFLYWYFRNTVFLFFRNFGLKDAVTKTYRQCKKYIRRARNSTLKVNRDYLTTSTTLKILLAIITGALAGIIIGLVFDKPLKKLVYKNPEYVMLLTILLTGATFQIIDSKNIVDVIENVNKA